MRVNLLGTVELVSAGEDSVPLAATKRRAVLAALALELNRVVSGDRLLSLVWDGAPPPQAKAALQGHVAQLRKLLGSTLDLVTRAPGYALLGDRNAIDVFRFEDLVAGAWQADDETAAERADLGAGAVARTVPGGRAGQTVARGVRDQARGTAPHRRRGTGRAADRAGARRGGGAEHACGGVGAPAARTAGRAAGAGAAPHRPPGRGSGPLRTHPRPARGGAGRRPWSRAARRAPGRADRRRPVPACRPVSTSRSRPSCRTSTAGSSAATSNCPCWTVCSRIRASDCWSVPPAWARRRWPCAGRTVSRAGSPTASCSSTCAGSPSAGRST